MVQIIGLSKDKDRGINTIEATFMKDGNIYPLRVNDDDRPETYREINELINQGSQDIKSISQELFNLMSPEAKVKDKISDSYYLSNSLSVRGGRIYFEDNKLEDTLSTHMLSLLDEENVPKDEKMWRSYVKFLDNLHQNADEDIRQQLFRWMDYENRAGNSFGITEDGCLVGYKGCGGTIFEPKSKFQGNAIVDGEEVYGNIPNKVSSVIQMPRSAVEVNPAVGCSVGLHVGTRDYATAWAPILLLVKVNPRDVVSVPYESDSQKIRVCEYTVLKVTDVEDEHQMYHPNEDNFDDYDEDDFDNGIVDRDEMYGLLGTVIMVETDEDGVVEGRLVHMYDDGLETIILIDDGEEFVDVELSQLVDFDDEPMIASTFVSQNETYPDHEAELKAYEQKLEEDNAMLTDEAHEIVNRDMYILLVRDDGKEYEGKAVDVYESPVKDTGIIIKSNEGDYSHIKLNRITFWEELIQDDLDFTQDDETFGRPECESGPEYNEDCEKRDDCPEEFKDLCNLKHGQSVVIVHRDKKHGIKASVGEIASKRHDELMELMIRDSKDQELIVVRFEDVVTLQITS